MTSHSDVAIFTSLRYDPQCAQVEPENGPFYMLHLHRDRLVESARYFGFESAIDRFEGKDGLDWLKESLEGKVKEWKRQSESGGGDNGPLKIRAIFTSTGYMTAEISSVPSVSKEALYPSTLLPPPPASELPSIKPFKPSAATGGALHTTSSSNPSQPTWHITLDTQPTTSGPYNTFKTLNRKAYEEARERVLPTARKEYQQYANHEVLMYDENGSASETSLCSVYFWRGGKWVTPPVTHLPYDVKKSGNGHHGPGAGQEGDKKMFRWGQRGTTRRYALAEGLCKEEDVKTKDLKPGEVCWISNGVRGFAMAVLGEGGGLAAGNNTGKE
ncbi:hypothetical protein NA57DRAFT_80821 [Rhizodiscina lignyota]|uniref:Aminodeoxychorismate lyase n=1 Tax=Rhizodiscina lignyota TaxID=1504668 RepID=A0A9P4M5G7_9PEZI|nr:hypothetical protein NA57DRAFT_80821 [Rhizodiscina lignyota]